jgi:hypothetical protein
MTTEVSYEALEALEISDVEIGIEYGVKRLGLAAIDNCR